MTAQDREQLRLSLLRFLDANPTRWGLGTDLLHQMARAEGRHLLLRPEVEAELDYLEEKGLVVRPPKTVSPENRTWKITAAGRDFYAELSA